MNSRNLYVGSTPFPKASSIESQADGSGKSKLSKLSKVGTGSTQLGKRKRTASDKPPPVRKSKPNFKVGDYVGLHESKLDKYHVPWCKCLVKDVCFIVAREFSGVAMLRVG